MLFASSLEHLGCFSLCCRRCHDTDGACNPMPLRSIRASACRIDVCLATTNMPRCTAGFAYVTINNKCQSLLCQRHARVAHFEADICIDVTPLIKVQICGVDSYKNSSGLQVAHLSQSCVASPNTKRCRFYQSWRGVYTFRKQTSIGHVIFA